jgi:ferric-dicitrate binding protein FerR (iron transport regulator)
VNRPDNYGVNEDLLALLEELSPDEAESLRRVWELASLPESEESMHEDDVHDAWVRLEQAIHLGQPDSDEAADGVLPQGPAPRPRFTLLHGLTQQTRSVRWTVVAASAAIAIIAAALLFWTQRPVKHSAGIGQQLAISLPDGSRVELNSGSAVRYDRRMSDTRGVHLEGEAYFDVAHATRPFVVHTFNARVEVLGTRFATRAWPGGREPGTLVTVERGSVNVVAAGSPESAVQLDSGETARVTSHNGEAYIDRPNISIEDALAWREGSLVFIDDVLSEVLDDIERRFNVEITARPDSLLERRVRLSVREPEDAESVLRGLALALDVQLTRTADSYLLTERHP